MSIQLGKEHMAAIIRHGEAAYPFEGCGLLLGREADGCKVVVQVLSVENTREPEAKHNRYLIPPEAMIEAEQVATRQGLDVIGFFHSHPDHPEQPSDFDREHAWPWYSYLVTSVHEGRAVKTAAWTLSDDRAAFIPEELIEESKT